MSELPILDDPYRTPLEALNERIMLDRLRERYSADPGNGSRYVYAEHVRSKLGFADRSAALRTADFIAADKWPSSMALHGHEVKVSRSDWLVELRDPDKAEAFRRYMHYWWLVVPRADIVRDDLPEGWGLMVLSNGRLRVKKSAPRLDPEPLPLDMAISFAYAAAKTAKETS